MSAENVKNVEKYILAVKCVNRCHLILYKTMYCFPIYFCSKMAVVTTRNVSFGCEKCARERMCVSELVYVFASQRSAKKNIKIAAPALTKTTTTTTSTTVTIIAAVEV